MGGTCYNNYEKQSSRFWPPPMSMDGAVVGGGGVILAADIAVR